MALWKIAVLMVGVAPVIGALVSLVAAGERCFMRLRADRASQA